MKIYYKTIQIAFIAFLPNVIKTRVTSLMNERIKHLWRSCLAIGMLIGLTL